MNSSVSPDPRWPNLNRWSGNKPPPPITPLVKPLGSSAPVDLSPPQNLEELRTATKVSLSLDMETSTMVSDSPAEPSTIISVHPSTINAIPEIQAKPLLVSGGWNPVSVSGSDETLATSTPSVVVSQSSILPPSVSSGKGMGAWAQPIKFISPSDSTRAEMWPAVSKSQKHQVKRNKGTVNTTSFKAVA
ncbi:hypothetical protein AALP_AAs55038U000100 [Arabis alpina]|uniref:Uncharacterized protein n=1 Tax=Arabis alpina TaxID=50452 RepID=A0A087G316_ARAAL|nr:hypothetical protein AALP_AAs55038U000100 [Arabis alpina]